MLFEPCLEANGFLLNLADGRHLQPPCALVLLDYHKLIARTEGRRIHDEARAVVGCRHLGRQVDEFIKGNLANESLLGLSHLHLLPLLDEFLNVRPDLFLGYAAHVGLVHWA